MKPRFTFDSWIMLQELSEAGSIGQLAARRGISPSTALRRLRGLEETTGKRLFTIRGGRAVLSPNGIAAAARATAAVKSLLGTPPPASGGKPVPVMVDPKFGISAASAFLSAATRSSGLSLLVSEGTAQGNEDFQGVAISVRRNLPRGETPLREFPRTLAGSSLYFKTHEFPFSVGSLRDHTLIGIEGDSAFSRILGVGRNRILVPGIDAGVRLAREGAGILLGISLERLKAESQDGALTAVPVASETGEFLSVRAGASASVLTEYFPAL